MAAERHSIGLLLTKTWPVVVKDANVWKFFCDRECLVATAAVYDYHLGKIAHAREGIANIFFLVEGNHIHTCGNCLIHGWFSFLASSNAGSRMSIATLVAVAAPKTISGISEVRQ